MTNNLILEDFERKKSLLESLKPRVSSLIFAFLKENAMAVHDVQSRIKEMGSLKKKIEKKQDKYNELSDITDIIGIRIITFFNDDVDRIASIIKEEFVVDVENSVDKRITDSDRFGYSSLHYIVEFKPQRLQLIEYKDFKGIKFEIQIRSILQHAWAEIEHDLGYKSENEIPKDIRRDFSRIAGLLELADKEFIRIKEFLEEYTHKVEDRIENKSLDVPIDKITLNEYVEKSELISGINEEILFKSQPNISLHYNDVAESNIPSLKFFSITTLSELDLLLEKYREDIIKFYSAFNEKEILNSENYITNDTAIFYLYYVLIYHNYSHDFLRDYLNVSKISSEELPSLINDFETYKKKKLLD